MAALIALLRAGALALLLLRHQHDQLRAERHHGGALLAHYLSPMLDLVAIFLHQHRCYRGRAADARPLVAPAATQEDEARTTASRKTHHAPPPLGSELRTAAVRGEELRLQALGEIRRCGPRCSRSEFRPAMAADRPFSRSRGGQDEGSGGPVEKIGEEGAGEMNK